MHKSLLFSCLLALSTSSQALWPAPKPNTLTRAIATILFYLPFLDATGLISADIIEDEDILQADLIWAARDLSEQEITVNAHDLEPNEEEIVIFEGIVDGYESFMKIWKFNRNPDACFRIRLRFRNAPINAPIID